ncbi:hypothetical protein ACFL5Z_06700 [Planctomycetota bacterium]
MWQNQGAILLMGEMEECHTLYYGTEHANIQWICPLCEGVEPRLK